MAQFTIRIPDETHALLKQAAADDKRSVNGEIEWAIDLALATRSSRGRVIHHRDGNPYNNDPANLEIVDPKENGQ